MLLGFAALVGRQRHHAERDEQHDYKGTNAHREQPHWRIGHTIVSACARRKQLPRNSLTASSKPCATEMRRFQLESGTLGSGVVLFPFEKRHLAPPGGRALV
jgi:hypothetical protein